MIATYWTYHQPEKRRTLYRGFVKEYQGQQLIKHYCPDVHESRLKAQKDADRLKTKLKQCTTNS